MANAVAERAWKPSSADRVEADLAALWQEVARRAPVSRAVMSNLLVFCRCPADADVELGALPEQLPIDEVVRRHPARVILLHHDPEAVDSLPPLAATVSVITFGPVQARYGIEQIAIKSACGAAALPSIVRPLLLGDVPTSVWWTEDVSTIRLPAPIVALGRQLLYDSRQWHDVQTAVLSLAPLLDDTSGPAIADINWRRLAAVRQGFLHALGPGPNTPQDLPAPVRIRHHPHEGVLAHLLAGWIAARCGMQGGSVRLEEDPRLVEEMLALSFGAELDLRLRRHQVTVEAGSGSPRFSIPVRSETVAEAVSAELRALSTDPGLSEALRALKASLRT